MMLRALIKEVVTGVSLGIAAAVLIGFAWGGSMLLDPVWHFAEMLP